MNKAAIVYWSGTGNTEAMANAIANGASNSTVFEVSEFSPSMIKDFDVIAFGCPAMGSEELEEDEFKPLWDDCIASLNGKSIGLFGSYDWGNCEWMQAWEEEAKSAGAILKVPSLTVNLSPDDTAIDACKTFGENLIK